MSKISSSPTPIETIAIDRRAELGGVFAAPPDMGRVVLTLLRDVQFAALLAPGIVRPEPGPRIALEQSVLRVAAGYARVVIVANDGSGPLSLKRILSQVLGVDEPDALPSEDAARACERLLFPEQHEPNTILMIHDAEALEVTALRSIVMMASQSGKIGQMLKLLFVGDPGFLEVWSAAAPPHVKDRLTVLQRPLASMPPAVAPRPPRAAPTAARAQSTADVAAGHRKRNWVLATVSLIGIVAAWQVYAVRMHAAKPPTAGENAAPGMSMPAQAAEAAAPDHAPAPVITANTAPDEHVVEVAVALPAEPPQIAAPAQYAEVAVTAVPETSPQAADKRAVIAGQPEEPEFDAPESTPAPAPAAAEIAAVPAAEPAGDAAAATPARPPEAAAVAGVPAAEPAVDAAAPLPSPSPDAADVATVPAAELAVDTAAPAPSPAPEAAEAATVPPAEPVADAAAPAHSPPPAAAEIVAVPAVEPAADTAAPAPSPPPAVAEIVAVPSAEGTANAVAGAVAPAPDPAPNEPDGGTPPQTAAPEAAAPTPATPAPVTPSPNAPRRVVEAAPQPAAAPTTQAIAVPVPSPPPPAPPMVRNLPPEVVATLIRRGDDMAAKGDISAARLFYERAAEAGSAVAARAAGRMSDPGVLGQIGVVGFRGDPEKAKQWYRRAIALGDQSAVRSLEELEKAAH